MTYSVADYLTLRRGNLRTVAASCRGEAASLLAELERPHEAGDGAWRREVERRAAAECQRAECAERAASFYRPAPAVKPVEGEAA